MDIKFLSHYYARKVLLTFFGPAQMTSQSDPMEKLEREWEEHYGPKEDKEANREVHIPKRHFNKTSA